MEDYPIINRKLVQKNKNLKRNGKEYRKTHKPGSKAVLKNYIGKLVSISSKEPIQDCSLPTSYISNGPEQSELIRMIEEVNLTGMSGNGYPVADKLRTFVKSKNRRILIVNAVECEPGLLQDEWLLENKATAIDKGMEYLNQAFHFQKMIIATKQITKDLADKEFLVPARYPMGEEHFLIHEVLGLQLDKSEIPAKQGILVMNAQTVFQISQLVNDCYTEGHYITLANLKTGEARITYAAEKEDLRSLLSPIHPEHLKAYAGGGVMAAHAIEEHETISSRISFVGVIDLIPIKEANRCKKCGACSHKCPMGIKVKDIVLRLEREANADISDLHPDHCIGCGTCTYFCSAAKDVEKIVRSKRGEQ